MTQKIINDPIHGKIVFEMGDDVHPVNKGDDLIYQLIRQPEFQRLNGIKQQGLAQFVYPAATHTRLIHSIGVFNMARKMLKQIYKFDKDFYAQNERRALAVKCAALLHDTGHGPFSHAFERVMKDRGVKKDHEEWTAEIIEGSTHINRVLRNYVDDDFPTEVADIIRAEEGGDIFGSIVSAQLDADRMDYIQRDLKNSGLTDLHSSIVDHDSLISEMHVVELELDKLSGDEADKGQTVKTFALREGNGQKLAEQYLSNRYDIYKEIGHSPEVRAAEEMLVMFFSSLADVIEEGRIEEVGFSREHRLIDFMSKDTHTLRDYLPLEDFAFHNVINELTTRAEDDPNIDLEDENSDLPESIRNLYISATRLTFNDTLVTFEVEREVKKELVKANPDYKDEDVSKHAQSFLSLLQKSEADMGFKKNINIFYDYPRLSGYKRYEGAINPNKRILIQNDEGDINDIHRVSDMVRKMPDRNRTYLHVTDENSLTNLRRLLKDSVANRETAFELEKSQKASLSYRPGYKGHNL